RVPAGSPLEPRSEHRSDCHKQSGPRTLHRNPHRMALYLLLSVSIAAAISAYSRMGYCVLGGAPAMFACADRCTLVAGYATGSPQTRGLMENPVGIRTKAGTVDGLPFFGAT